MTASPAPAPARAVVRLAACLLLASLPAVLDPGAIARASALWPLAQAEHPYWVPEHAALVQLWAPLVSLSGCVLVLAPGLLLALLTRAGDEVGRWLVTGLALSIVGLAPLVELVEAALGRPLAGGEFAALALAGQLAAAGTVLGCLRRGAPERLPFREPGASASLASAAVVPFLLLALLAPKFFWESLSDDGAHAFEAARLLLWHPLPFWSPDAGVVASYPGMKTLLTRFPTAWFIRLFGEYEASARIPYLLFLVGLYGGLLGVIQLGKDRPLQPLARWLVWLGFAGYTVAMAFSAAYNPYHADLALPGAEDTLLVALLLGFAIALLRGETAWVVLWTVLAFTTSPAGLVGLGVLLAAFLLTGKPRPVRQAAAAVAALVGCLALEPVAARLLPLLGLPGPGIEHRIGGLAGRLFNLRWDAWHRFAFFVVPAGIVPAVSLLWWKAQDRIARAFTLAAVGYFGFFYLQARTSLHYYVPAMLLPLVVLWRYDLTGRPRWRRALPGLVAVGALVALGLSWPRAPAPQIAARLVGMAVEDRLGGYERHDPAVFRHAELLHALFPRSGAAEVPARSYGGSALEWLYYAHRPPAERAGTAIAYVLQPADQAPPPGARRAAADGGAALYVLDEAALARHLALRPAAPQGSRLYLIPRHELFGRRAPAPAGAAPPSPTRP